MEEEGLGCHRPPLYDGCFKFNLAVRSHLKRTIKAIRV